MQHQTKKLDQHIRKERRLCIRNLQVQRVTPASFATYTNYNNDGQCSYLLMEPAYNKVLVPDLPTPKYFCPYSEQAMSVFSDFWPDFLADTPPISQNKTVSKVNFSIIQLVQNSLWTHIFNLIQTHYTRTTLFCLRLRKSFSIIDCTTLSAKTMHHVCCFRWCRRVLS